MSRPGPGPGHRGFVPGEKPKDTKGTLLRLLGYMKPYKVSMILVAAMTVLTAIAGNLGPRIIGFATNEIQLGWQRIQAGTGGMDLDAIGIILLLLGGIYLLNSLFVYLQSRLLVNMTQKTMYQLRRRVDEKIKTLPIGYYDSHQLGDILSRVTNDVDTVSASLQQSVTQILSSVLSVITILVMMLVISPVLTLVALLTLPLTVLLSTGVIKRSQPLFVRQQSSLGHLNGHIEEMYSGHNVIKAFGREESVLAEFDQINEERYQSSYMANYISGIIHPLSNLISNLGYAIVTVVGGLMVISGSLLVGDIQSFAQYLRNFSQPITQLSNIMNTLQSTIAAAERIFGFLDETEEEPVPDEKLQYPAERKGSVCFEHVRFGYTPDRTLIKDFNLEVKAGEMVAIVGPTGAGKTTLVNLLLRFYDVNGGRILVDGVDIADMDRIKLREYFGMVLQDTWLFHGTIRDNIRYGRVDATDGEVQRAARTSYAHNFIRTLPGGYNMVLSEDASNISQGQRQLITIARALLSNPRILILDEATSSVDTRTEVLIQKAMKTLMEGRTSFVIAHRLSTIRDADKILVLNDGDIVEVGTHDQLLAKGGFYADLYNSQFAYNNASGE
ncbi:MAG: ABC transporter ATP-binding protein [Oscillospiraceae bacterium]|nr:ABC transporter ATP-binding protein [Oscillospiraceae bacterium]